MTWLSFLFAPNFLTFDMGSKHSVLLPEDVGSLHSAEDIEFNSEKKILVLGTGETGTNLRLC
jgi:hypothetical protein